MINSYQLSHGTLHAVERLDAEVMLFSNPDAAERDLLHSHFKLDDHALASALDPDEVSRIEFHPDNLFLIWKRPDNYSGADSLAFEVSSCGLLFCPDRLLVIATDDAPLSGLGKRQPLNTPLDVLLELLFNNIHHYLGHLKVIKMVARELQQKFNASMQNQHLIQMFNLSESLIYYINAIHSNGAVLTRLRNHARKAALRRPCHWPDRRPDHRKQPVLQTGGNLLDGVLRAHRRPGQPDEQQHEQPAAQTDIDQRGVFAAEPDREYWRHVRVQHDDGGDPVVGFLSVVFAGDDVRGGGDVAGVEAVGEVMLCSLDGRHREQARSYSSGMRSHLVGAGLLAIAIS